ncbi:MAG: LUD domain-containing protein [Zymomonas mobilis subsp. pomaceae]|uniref:LutC/YkgG family protein n=1 Tax=Zymomonas mobilis TaxID=542 RepID=UPI0039E8AABF
MNSRQLILENLCVNRPKTEPMLPEIPLFDTPVPVDRVAKFKEAVVSMGGEIIHVQAQGLDAALKKYTDEAKVICSHVPEIKGNLEITGDTQPTDLADVDVGIVRASFAVAETGSVCLTDADFGINSLGYLPQHLIVLVDPEDIVYNLHHAYRRSEGKKHAYMAFHTGPSATADIEGILIHGAQGVRSLSVILQPRLQKKSEGK